MTKITDETPIAMLTVGQLKEILSIDKIMGHLTPSRAPDKEVLTAADLARLTGYSISTVYKLTSERKIPFHKPEHKGRKLYFNREEILDWLQSESHPTIEQENIQKIKQLKKEIKLLEDKQNGQLKIEDKHDGQLKIEDKHDGQQLRIY